MSWPTWRRHGAAELVFQVLSERHERGSLIVTTNWADPVLRSTCCESRVGVVPSTLGEAARVRAAGGQAAGAGSVQAAAKTAGALRPRAECGRCWFYADVRVMPTSGRDGVLAAVKGAAGSA